MNNQISSQYLTKDKISVTILDVIDPAHYVVKESADLSNASSKAQNFLEAEEAMQRYYASVEPCFFQLPLKDAIVVVLHNEIFYRARVIRILTLSAGHLFKVYLVDYGIECSIPREKIYEIEKDFLIHPFQAVNFKLLGIEPISLIISKTDLTISYGPVSEWDQSASIYIRDLKKSLCSAYIEVQGVDDLHIYGRLFMCFEGSLTKCINDELVSQSFARFNEEICEKVKKLESNSGKTDSTKVENNLEKANPEQVPDAVNLSDTELDSNFKMMFINPSDGKIIAESTLQNNTAKNLSAMNEESMLQDEATNDVISDLHVSVSKSPSKSEEETSTTEIQLVTQKHLQKLLKKKKRLPSVQASCDNNANNEDLSIKNKTMESCTIPQNKNSCTIFSNDVNLKNSDRSNRLLNSSVNEDKKNLENPSDSLPSIQNNKINVINQTVNKNELIKSPGDELKSTSNSESNVLMDVMSRAEENSEAENTTQAQLIAQKSLMKLQQLKRKSQSPNTKTSPTVSAGSCTERLTAIKTIQSDISLSDQSCQSQSLDETVPEPSESFPKQESESVVLSDNLRQLQRLQKKVQKKKTKVLSKESSQVLQKTSSGLNQTEELAVDTSYNSSLCDSDSGLNSCSSTPVTPEKIEQ